MVRSVLAIPYSNRLIGRGARRAAAFAVGALAGNGLPLAFTALPLSVIIALLLFIVYMTFVPGLPTDPGFTLEHWTNVGSARILTRVIPNTLVVGFGAIVVAGFFAVPIAWLLNRTTLPFRNTFITLIALVPVVPGFVVAMGWILLLDERIGMLNRVIGSLVGMDSVPLSVMNNLYGIGWVMGLILAPAVFFLIAGPMRSLDPALEEAAMASGAGPWRTFWRVDLPLLWPSILGGLIYTFMTAVSIFEVPALLGAAGGRIPVLATELFYTVRPGGALTATFAYGAAGVYGLLLAAPSLVALYFYHRLMGQTQRYQVVTGKGYRPRDVELGRFTWLGVAFVSFYLLMAIVLPLLVLLWASLMPVLQLPSQEALGKITLAHYLDLFGRLGGLSVLVNTVVLAVVVSLLVCFFSLMISWVVVRTAIPLRNLIDSMAMVPHAVPGIAFAFALAMLAIFAAVSLPWLPVGGTLGIIVLAHLVNRLPYGTRVANAALMQIHRELQEAAELSGAGYPTIMWRVIMPLIKPSLVFLVLWTAVLSLQEVSMALFLSGPHNRVLSVTIWMLWEGSYLGSAAAGAVMMALVLGTIMFVILRFAGRAPGGRLGIVARPEIRSGTR